jgi:hypothetical protein
VSMPSRPNEAAEIISEYFGVRGRFSECAPAGMSASTYPKALAIFLRSVSRDLQRDTVGVLLSYAIDGTHPFSRASAYACADIVQRGLSASFEPHVAKIKEWFESGIRSGWWMTDADYESAPLEAKNAIPLMNVLWFCDRSTASDLTEILLAGTTSKEIRDSLEKSKLLPQAWESALDSGQ